MKLGCVQLLMKIYSDHSLEIVLCYIDRNELSGCNQLKVCLELPTDWLEITCSFKSTIGEIGKW